MMEIDRQPPWFSSVDPAVGVRMIEELWSAALEAVNPAPAVRRGMIESGSPANWRPDAGGRLMVFALGKASRAMSIEAVQVARAHGVPVSAVCGVVATPDNERRERGSQEHEQGYGGADLDIIPASHPLPDAASLRAGARALRLSHRAGPRDRVLILLSGGGSALAEAPVVSVSLDDLRRTTSSLLNAGLDIESVNAVRKHLSRLKGGRLARAADPAAWQTIAISDVVGDVATAIASGPTVADPTSFRDARRVLERIGRDGVISDVPPSVGRWIRRGAARRRAETPFRFRRDRDQPRFQLVATIDDALDAIEEVLVTEGIDVVQRRGAVTGEAAEAGRRFADELVRLRGVVSSSGGGRRALLWGGEVTVTVEDASGTGGPCQEFALAAVLRLREATGQSAVESRAPDSRGTAAERPESTTALPPITIAALSTDGRDGRTDAAGAVVTDSFPARQTVRAARRGLSNHDAYTVLENEEALVRTGLTGTNVNDVYLGIVG